MSTPAVEVQNLSSRYGTFTAVDDLSFYVEPGELYALLGTNGAGKTTTLETVEGHRTPSRGTVTVFGGALADRRSIRPRVGMMLQESGFAGDLTVEETVNLVGKLSDRTDDTARLLEKSTWLASARFGSRNSRVERSAAWTSPPRSTAPPSSFSSTSRRTLSTPRRATHCGAL